MLRLFVCTFYLLIGTTAVNAAQEENKTMPETIDVPRLYRVILPVDDIDRAQRFYSDLLGIAGKRVSPGRHYFHGGDVILAVADPRADGDSWDARPNQDHVYFSVENLETFHQRATRLGGLSEQMGAIEQRPWGEVSFYMKDPFGNPLCFVDETTLFTGQED